MYRITYVHRGLQGLLRVEGLKTSPGTKSQLNDCDHQEGTLSVESLDLQSPAQISCDEGKHYAKGAILESAILPGARAMCIRLFDCQG